MNSGNYQCVVWLWFGVPSCTNPLYELEQVSGMKEWEDWWSEQIGLSWALHKRSNGVNAHAVCSEICTCIITHGRRIACLISVWCNLSLPLIWLRCFSLSVFFPITLSLRTLISLRGTWWDWEYVKTSRFCGSSDLQLCDNWICLTYMFVPAALRLLDKGWSSYLICSQIIQMLQLLFTWCFLGFCCPQKCKAFGYFIKVE